jgi:hypothetical protein
MLTPAILEEEEYGAVVVKTGNLEMTPEMENMMHELKWENVKPLLDVNSISLFCERFRVRFPEEFKSLVTHFNGSTPDRKRFNTDRAKERVILHFLSFNENEKNGIFQTTNRMRNSGYPENLIPFARDPFGNLICFDFTNSGYSIVFWNHEDDKLEKISDTFSGFLASLY